MKIGSIKDGLTTLVLPTDVHRELVRKVERVVDLTTTDLVISHKSTLFETVAEISLMLDSARHIGRTLPNVACVSCGDPATHWMVNGDSGIVWYCQQHLRVLRKRHSSLSPRQLRTAVARRQKHRA